MEDAQTIQQLAQELHTLRQQAVTAQAQSRQLLDLEQRLARLHHLTLLNQGISSSLNMDEVLHAIIRAAAALMQAPVTSAWLVHEATRTLEFHSCADERAGADWLLTELSFDQGGVGWVATHRKMLHVPDVFLDDRIVATHWFRAHGLRSALTVPIMLGDALLAIISMVRTQPFQLTPDDQHVLDTLLAQSAVAIRNARIYHGSEDRRRRLTTLVDVTQRLTRGLDLATVLQAIVDAAALMFAGEASVRLLEGEMLTRVAATRGRVASLSHPQVPIGVSVCGHVAMHRQPMIVPDMALDSQIAPEVRTALRGEWLRSLLCVPVHVGTRILGTLQVYRERDQLFAQDDLTLAISLADQAAIAIENARLFQEAQEHAHQLAAANAALQGEITERQRAETARQRLEAQLRQAQKMEALGTLAGGIAHDFNNILAIILGYTELLLLDLPPGALEWQNMQQILIAGGRAKRLVQQILAFSRQGEQKRQPVQLSFIVQETLTLLRASLPSSIDLRQSLSKDTGVVMADPTQLQQVLMNLCTNAEHAMRPKGGWLEVCLDAVLVDATMAAAIADLLPGPYARLTVRDSGRGMTPDVLERIFDPFFTTKGPGEGTGLGLAVVHGIITSYKGAITVVSTPGQGTTFAIYLPCVPGLVEPAAPAEELLPQGYGRILFVDDEAALAPLAQAMLTRLGYVTETYTSSRDALMAFQQKPQRFDLVITDQTMPYLTGEAFAHALRHIRPDIPIILCTGFSHTMTPEKAASMGIDAFLMKPLVIHDLGLAIQRILSRPRSVC